MNHVRPEVRNADDNQGFVLIANEILRKCKIKGDVESLEQCSDSYFVAVYEGILGEPLRDVVPNAVHREDKVFNCATVIDALSSDVLNVDLSHITGEDIVDGDLNSIQNLLEIFKELLDFILDVDENLDEYDEDEQNDSNLLSSDHEVITNVLKEELGSSYQDLSTLKRLPKNENAKNHVELFSSQGSLTDTDISEIPKWCRSVGSSKSSEYDSNSTGEIIRESERLGHQLVREYPSLLELNEKKRYECNQNLKEPRGIAREKETLTKNVMNKVSMDRRGPTGNVKLSTTNGESSVVKDDQRSERDIEDDGQQEQKCIRTRDEKEPDDIAGMTNKPSTVRTVSGPQVELMDRNTLNNERLHYRVRNEEERTGGATVDPNEEAGEPNTIMDRNGLRRETRAKLELHTESLEVSLEDKAIQTTAEPVKETTFQVRSERSVDPRTVPGARLSAVEPGEGRIPVECEGVDSPNLNNGFVELGNTGSTEETLKSKLQPSTSGKTRKEGEARSRLKHNRNEDYVERDSQIPFEDEHTDGSDTSGILWDDQISPLDASEEFQGKGTGLSFDKVGRSVERIDRPKKHERQKVGENQDADGRGSPVHRHYHHHFHHSHGRSEDLIRNLECASRVENSEDERRRSLLRTKIPHVDPNSVYITKSAAHRNVPGRALGDGQSRCTKKDDRSAKRSVRFNDDVDMLLITNKLERLKREMEKDEEEQRGRRFLIKSSYGGHLDRLNDERKRVEKELNQFSKSVTKRSPRRQKRRVSRDRTKAVYGKGTSTRKARYPSGKVRRRSASCSPKVYDKRKPAKQLEKGDVLLPAMLEEFPFLHLSPHTMQTMRKKQTQQLLALSKSAAERRQTKTQKVIEDAEKRQQTLLKILRKDLLHTQRMREQKERQEQERAIKSKLREKRQASARARRYYEDYQLRMRARLLKRRTREEQIFKSLFQDGLEIQKQRVQELRAYAKEQRETQAVRQQNELESLENYYRDQYSILAEAIVHEKEALKIREKAQEKVIHEMQRNLRKKLQEEVADIQETLVRDEDNAYFRRLDAERLRGQMQMTAFQNFS